MKQSVIKKDDKAFTETAQPGDPDCICSRCGKPIEKQEYPITSSKLNVQLVIFRYHVKCIREQFEKKNQQKPGI